AADYAGRAAVWNPRNVEALTQQMWAMLELGEHKRVSALLDRLLQVQNRDLATITLVAAVHDQIEQHDAAIAALEWGEAVAGDDAAALAEVARAYADIDEEQRSATVMRRALRLRPDDPALLRQAALARHAAGDSEAALADLDRALA